MKAITINVQISKCPKQYESVRLGGEWTVDEGETPDEVMTKALEVLNQFYAKSQAPKTKPQPQTENNVKQTLVFERDTNVIQQICKRIEGGVKLDTVLDYYEPDEQTMNVLKLAAKLN